MKRRDFLRSAGAAAVIPVLPLPAMATPVATAPVNAFQVGWAALYARANHRATPALLQKWLRIDAGQANAMMNELVRRNIVHSPVAGTAVAVKPMYGGSHANGLFGRPTKIADNAKKVFDALADERPDVDLADTSTDLSDDMPQDEPELTPDHSEETADATS